MKMTIIQCFLAGANAGAATTAASGAGAQGNET